MWENQISIPEVNLVGVFSCLASPVQAEGTIDEHPFYFRSRHDAWTFAVASDEKGDPVEIYSSSQGFFREANYGDDQFSASYMPLNDAREIIARCAKEFVEERDKGI